MKRVLAATALSGLALILSGCIHSPLTYRVENRTDAELTLIITRTDCASSPQSRDDYSEERSIAPGTEVEAYGVPSGRCIHVLSPDRRIVLETPFNFDSFGGGQTYTIRDATPISHATIPAKNSFPGPSLSERVSDSITSIGNSIYILGLIAIIVVLFGVIIVGSFCFVLAIPVTIGYIALLGFGTLRKRRRPPLN